MSFLFKIFGDANERYLKSARFLVDEINQREKEFEKFSNEQIKNKTLELKKRIADGGKPESVLTEAFALVREAAKRTIQQRPYDVQLVGGVVLHQGKIAEMKTGEGKTLTATLAVYLNALEGKGAHVVTVGLLLYLIATALPEPTSHAYAATAFVTLAYTALHCALGIVFALYGVWRISNGFVSARRSLDLRIGKLWHDYTALTGVVGIVLVLVMPLIVAIQGGGR